MFRLLSCPNVCRTTGVQTRDHCDDSLGVTNTLFYFLSAFFPPTSHNGMGWMAGSWGKTFNLNSFSSDIERLLSKCVYCNVELKNIQKPDLEQIFALNVECIGVIALCLFVYYEPCFCSIVYHQLCSQFV